jgi:hypothetical protein
MTIVEERPNCPKCGQGIEAHWTLPMDDEEFAAWDNNETVCDLTRGEVNTLIYGLQDE